MKWHETIIKAAANALSSLRVVCAEDATLSEKIRDVSPDQKFGLRISYDQKEDERIAAKNDPGEHRLTDGIFRKQSWKSIWYRVRQKKKS